MGLKKKEDNENINKGIMLNYKSKYKNIIAITLILAIILIVLLTLNNVGVLNKTGKTKEQMTEAEATAKLEQALETVKTKKETDETYNKEQYINDLLEAQNISIHGDIVAVSGYNYQIDRENLSITQELGKANVEITTKVLNLLGQNDKGKERATIEIEVTSNVPLENIVYQNEDRTYAKETTSELTYKKELELELDKDYVITVETKDGKLNTKVFKNTKEDYKEPSAQ